MSFTTISPYVAAALWLLFALAAVFAAPARRQRLWLLPAALAVVFAAFTAQAVLAEGLLGFWPEHTRNLWGNQIWFDLLLSVGVAWGLLLPQARALGMRPLPWLALIAATGSIGVLSMLARVLYLRQQPESTDGAAVPPAQRTRPR